MDSISIPVAKNIILPGVKATIFSWGFIFMEKEKDGIKNVTSVHALRKMEVIIEDCQINDKNIEKIRLTRFRDHHQMCGRSVQPGQQTSIVIILITFTNLRFSSWINCHKINAPHALCENKLFFFTVW